MSTPQTYDIVIAGGMSDPLITCCAVRSRRMAYAKGGTCGCIVASRLADADPSLSILVVEAGPPTRNDPLHTQPCRYLYHLRPESTTVKFHVGRPSDALAGRSPIVPCGQCLGGGSSVNCVFTGFLLGSGPHANSIGRLALVISASHDVQPRRGVRL